MRDNHINLLEMNELRKHTADFGEFLCILRFSKA